jgi:hypothetical protein
MLKLIFIYLLILQIDQKKYKLKDQITIKNCE